MQVATGTKSREECLEELGLTESASTEEVKAAYEDLIKVWHPDQFQEDDGLRRKAEEKLKGINLAYECLLRNPDPREPEPQKPEPPPDRPPATTHKSPPAAPATPTAPVPRAQSNPARFAIDQRYVAPLLVTSILIAGNFGFGVLESLPKTLLAVAAAIITEVVLGKLVTGKVPHLASAYITGISVGILIRSPFWWPYALCSMISITCKYVIRVKGRHIWNPSNFGIAMMLLIATDSVATLSIQWGNNVYPMAIIWALGSFIIYRLKRFHICLTYIASFFFFAFIRHLVTGHEFLAEAAPITGPMYQLYIFFMITDPKTTVLTKKGQILTAFAVALVEAALRLTGTFFAIHAPYYALFLVGPTANLIEIYQNSRRSAAVAAKA